MSVNLNSRRSEISKCALPLFLKLGYDGVSMSMVAQAVGGSKATLYRYFPNKAALFATLLEDVWGEIGAEPEPALYTAASCETWLFNWTRRFVEYLHRDDVIELYRLIIAEVGRFPALGADLFAKGPERGVADLSSKLSSFSDHGLLDCEDGLVAAHTLRSLAKVGCYDGRLWGVGAPPTPEEINEHSRHTVTLFLRLFGPTGREFESRFD